MIFNTIITLLAILSILSLSLVLFIFMVINWRPKEKAKSCPVAEEYKKDCSMNEDC